MTQKKETAVVYIITKLELGGAQKVCLRLFHSVYDEGDFDTILISGTDGKLMNEVANNTRARLLPSLQREVSGFGLLQELKAFYTLVRTLKTIKKQYAHVIVHTHSTKAGIYGRWAAWCAGIHKRIHTIHGYGFHSYQHWIPWIIIFSLEWITSLITTHFICVSSYDALVGLRSFPWFDKKYSMIRAATDTTQFIPAQKTTLDASANFFIFGTVACFKPQKNIFDLLKAFLIVHQQHPHTRLEIIGDGILRKDIENWIQTHRLTDVITLHGWQENVSMHMQRWHAFTLSSLWEGLPCAVIEARLHKLPVLSYDTGGIKDVITHGVNGFLCAQKDWLQLAHHMIEITQNTLLYEKMRNHSDMLQAYTPESMVQEHIKLYKQHIDTMSHSKNKSI